MMGGSHLPSKGGCMEGGLASKAQCPWSAQCLQGFLEEAARPACSSWAEWACRQDAPSLQQPHVNVSTLLTAVLGGDARAGFVQAAALLTALLRR